MDRERRWCRRGQGQVTQHSVGPCGLVRWELAPQKSSSSWQRPSKAKREGGSPPWLHPCQPHPPNSDQHLPLGKPTRSPLSQQLWEPSPGGSPSHTERSSGKVRKGAEGDGPGASPRSLLSSGRTSSAGEGLTVWGTRFKEQGWTAGTGRWQPVPRACLLRITLQGAAPGQGAQMVTLELEAALPPDRGEWQVPEKR